MTKTQLEEELEIKNDQIGHLQTELDDLKTRMNDGVLISFNENNHYQELQRNTVVSMERADKLQEVNTELIKAIANLNGGVLKDLSETIVNITKRQ